MPGNKRSFCNDDILCDFEVEHCDRKRRPEKDDYRKTMKLLKEFCDESESNCDRRRPSRDCEDKPAKCRKPEDKCPKKECEKSECDDCACATYVVLPTEACDAPVLTAAQNVLYTPIPKDLLRCSALHFPEHTRLQYYARLPRETCDAVGFIWPLVYLLNEGSRFVTTSSSSLCSNQWELEYDLFVIASQLITDPAQASQVQNVGSSVNGPCICDTVAAAQYTYKIVYAFKPECNRIPDGADVELRGPSGVIANYVVDFNTDGTVKSIKQETVAAGNSAVLGLLFSMAPSGPHSFSLEQYDEILKPLLDVAPVWTPVGTISAAFEVDNGHVDVILSDESTPVNLVRQARITLSDVLTYIKLTAPVLAVRYVQTCESECCFKRWIASFKLINI